MHQAGRYSVWYTLNHIDHQIVHHDEEDAGHHNGVFAEERSTKDEEAMDEHSTGHDRQR